MSAAPVYEVVVEDGAVRFGDEVLERGAGRARSIRS